MQALDEVIDGSEYPMIDDRSIMTMERDFHATKLKIGFEEIGEIGGLKLLSTEWPFKSRPFLFLVNDQGEPVGEMHLLPKNGPEETIWRVSTVYIRPEYRGGTGMALYQFVLDHGYKLRSDKEHTADSKGLWAALARRFHVTHNGETVTDTAPYYDGKRSHFVAQKRA